MKLMRQKKFRSSAAVRLVLIGRGYVARRLVDRSSEGLPARAGLPVDIEAVTATHRPGGSPRACGDIPFAESDALIALLADATHLLLSAPPGPEGDPLLAMLGVDGLRRLQNLRWIGYLSSTGVYGDHAGAWIDEDSPRRATAAVSIRRLGSEDSWLAARDSGLPVTIFRLSGIYGPGRSALDALRRGAARRIDKPGHVFCRCHVDDICAVLERSMAGHGQHAVYNVADDLPAPQHQVVSHAAKLLGIKPPPMTPLAEADLSPAVRRFYEACRRVDNDRIKSDLGASLLYPTYRDGLDAILEEEKTTGSFDDESDGRAA